jgi:hypothetical protein
MSDRRRVLGLLAIAGAVGCDDRDPVWDAYVEQPATALAMNTAVAVVDAPAQRALVLPVDADLQLSPASLPIGQGYAASAATPDGRHLLVLSRGVVPRRTADDEGPSLSMIAASPAPQLVHRYELGDPLARLAVDPESRFAVAFPSSDDGTFVHNPNELVIFDLERGPSADNPVELTLRSFGGRPERLTFTPVLGLPGGERRLLVAETDRDVSLVDLDHLDLPEITIPLTSGPDPLAPAQVAVSDGDPDRDDDARVALRIAGDPNVIVVDLLPVADEDASATPQSFRASPNVVFVGGTPTDVAFVQTDGGLRLAAVVPSAQVLTLVDPLTGVSSGVELGAPFERMALVTSIVGPGEDGSDVALLWSSASPDIAFVALGSTVGKPYKSIERTELGQPIARVLDVPAPNGHLKLLQALDGRAIFVLDVRERTVAPIETSSSATELALSPTGERAWLSAGSAELAGLDLASLHPVNLVLSRSIDALFDIERSGGGRALIALHSSGALGATVLDGESPSLAGAREYFGLLLGGLP